MSFTEHLRQAAAVSGYELSEEQIHKFEIYYQLLVEWNQKMNLTAITEPAEVAVKHMVDSLTAFDEQLFFAGASVADVGTGAGFPGVPLKLFRPDLQLTLIDSLQKRLNFLTAVLEATGMEMVKILHYRAEEAGQKKELREVFDFVTSRAVARLPVLCELCLPLVKIGGYFVALKGAKYEEELLEAERALKVLGAEVAQVKPVRLPGLEDVRAVIYLKKVKPTPKAYPRRAGLPEKKPLI
nr:16S rRNA (guanine(527)-N(7))-methyltransferase RsmG [uncultured Anaeromusa sp.]